MWKQFHTRSFVNMLYSAPLMGALLQDYSIPILTLSCGTWCWYQCSVPDPN